MSLEQKLIIALESQEKEKKKEIFEEIYYTYYNLVCFCISQYIKNKQDIEELTNDVFISFFNSLDKNTIHNIKYYLTSISKHLSLNFLRDHKNSNFVLSNDEVIFSKENDYEKNEIINDLKEFLSSEEYYLITEHIVNERKLRSIAEELKIPYQNIKKKYYRIVQRIKKEMKVDEKTKSN